ncbi:DNA sulfur modification protein DndD [Massilia sp. KIM]|uniref:DNA sulfur modification protein DndD n=1 Tax=Massilia sp. KIM TaxID=1955422 RepID=UPI00098F05EB|nr:DNA sulfur modification protein DndD [Massilia sp. KIM]OON62703.1 DNA sulfur modification protein DndD [Massilia sp. KIM]
MLFQEFVLHNFGIYKGRHTVDLTTSPGRPIVLFGALNGSGKTTFLDGLQLVLYGKHARCTGRGNMAYPDFLRSTINRYVPPQEGAGLELEFIHHHEGKWQTIRVIRTWNGRHETTRERLEVYCDGILDAVLSERWGEFVEDFIPSQISELFFFDGEKIEALAEEQSAAAIIRTGIHALLGLDVVDRLAADIKIIQRRRRVDELSREAQALVRAKHDAMVALSDQADALAANIEQQHAQVEERMRALQAIEEEYRQQGGGLAEQANTIEAQLKAAAEQKANHDIYLRDKLAAGHLPLLLVEDLLSKARTQLTAEINAQLATAMLSEIRERDAQILSMLAQSEVSETVRRAVADQLERDRQARVTATQTPAYLHMRAEALAPYAASQFDDLRTDTHEALQREQLLAERVNDLERTKAALPDPELLAPLRQRLEEQRRQYEQALGAVALLNQQHEDCVQARERADRERQSLLLELADQDLKDKTNKRVLRHAGLVEQSLHRYRDAVLQRNVKRLADLILESFQSVTRKPKMFERIEISPVDYRLSLFDHSGNQVPSHQLSAGERQLLAVSILWGLSRASGRSLPAIIDTPLGRLDGQHRNKLVKNYFPKASHQVILLSTDQEIDEDLYGKIKRVTSQEYLIEYSEEKQSSEIHEGYFTFDEAYT